MIRRGVILVLDAIGRGIAAEMNPADIGRIEVPGTDELADDSAAVGVAAAINPAEVSTESIFVGGVDAGGGGGFDDRANQEQGSESGLHKVDLAQKDQV